MTRRQPGGRRPSSSSPSRKLPLLPIVAELTGGRRLLSDDLLTLESIAILVARRIDAIRITRERYQRELREQEIAKLVTEAELRALRAQVNPHFLFNALTTLGYLIQTAPDRALETLLRLTSLLRGVLRSEGEFATLGRDLHIVESYLEIEQARFEERLRIRIDVPPGLRTIRVPALLLQPIVENAVKHGVAPRQQGGDVTIRGTLARAAGGSLELCLTVADTGAGVTEADLRRGRALGSASATSSDDCRVIPERMRRCRSSPCLAPGPP